MLTKTVCLQKKKKKKKKCLIFYSSNNFGKRVKWLSLMNAVNAILCIYKHENVSAFNARLILCYILVYLTIYNRYHNNKIKEFGTFNDF